MQEVIFAEPPTVQVMVPVGAVAPVVPVTVAVNTKVEFKVPLPVPVSTIAGEALAIVTEIAEVGASDV